MCTAISRKICASAAEKSRLLAPVEQGLVNDQSMLHCRLNGEELIISAKDLRQVAEQTASQFEKSYATIVHVRLLTITLFT